METFLPSYILLRTLLLAFAQNYGSFWQQIRWKNKLKSTFSTFRKQIHALYQPCFRSGTFCFGLLCSLGPLTVMFKIKVVKPGEFVSLQKKFHSSLYFFQFIRLLTTDTSYKHIHNLISQNKWKSNLEITLKPQLDLHLLRVCKVVFYIIVYDFFWVLLILSADLFRFLILNEIFSSR